MKNAEPIILTAAVAAANAIIAPEDPGFSGLMYTPYAASACLAAVLHSRAGGFAAALLSVAAAAALYLVKSIPSGSFFPAGPGIMLLVTAAPAYIFGSLKRMDQLKITALKERHRELSRTSYRLNKLVSAQMDIARELEERVARQKTTINTLYNQMHMMDSLNLQQTLDTLLQTISIFSGAEEMTVWTYSRDMEMLVPAAIFGAQADSSSYLSLDSSTEGWVYRNNRMTSVRMMNRYSNLQQIDNGRTILCFPLNLNRKIWGVLSIEKMPFFKYNQYTEKLLQIIINLAEPTLSRAVEHWNMLQESETDNTTGLPLFSRLYTTLERLTSNAGENERISILVLELGNYKDTAGLMSPEERRILVSDLENYIQMGTAGKADFFMYKEKNQIAAVIEGLDEDGASLLSLEILDAVNSREWKAEDRDIRLEITIGYSVFGIHAHNTEGLLKHADYLLEIQKM